jgi:hypothetical protein
MSDAAIAGVPVSRTGLLINENTRICNLNYALPKFGKTTMAATMHEWCLKEYGKPGIIIAFEAADGGGATSIRDYDMPIAQPTDLKSTEGMLRALVADSTYSLVVIDNLSDMVKNIVQPYALTFPSREHVATRSSGVPERSDYQTIAEKTRQLLNLMIALTKGNPNNRKHLIVNALRTEKRNNQGDLEYVGPDLPGQLREIGPAPFELVSRLEIKTKVVPSQDNPKMNVRQKVYSFITSGDGIAVCGDRYKVFPSEGPADWNILMNEYWKPAIEKTKQ